MRTIYKYGVPIGSNQTVWIPEDAQILCVQVQGHDRVPKVWALVDPAAPLAPHTFTWYMTGRECDAGTGEDRYVGTVQLDEGALVFHLFVMP